MELDRIASRKKNPLASLAAEQAMPAKAIIKASQQHFPLMELLPELRIRIYECVFADLASSLTPRSLSTVQNLDDHLRVRLKEYLALLHASRALRSETIEVYCLRAKASLATLGKTIQSMYAGIDLSRKIPSWAILMEAHARELAMAKLQTFLLVIKFVMIKREGKRGWNFATFRTAMEVYDTDRMGCD